jgi:hypothetical protein
MQEFPIVKSQIQILPILPNKSKIPNPTVLDLEIGIYFGFGSIGILDLS